MQERKRTTLYIDAANLVSTAKNFNLNYDIYFLIEYLKYKYDLTQCIYFTGKFSFDLRLYKQIESYGVEIVFKEVYNDYDKNAKANCDVEIAERITLDLEYKRVDKIVLLSGDGDFYSLLKKAETLHLQVKVLGVIKDTTSRLYRENNKFSLSYVSQIIRSGALIKRENLVGALPSTRLFLYDSSIAQPQTLSSGKKVLFFGDSLTFGLNAKTNDRFLKEERWTTIVEKFYKNNFELVVEGQCGRTIDGDDNIEGKNGLKSFESAMYSHLYVDYIFIMLGTNNLKEKFRANEMEIAGKFLKYKNELEYFAKDWECIIPKVILIAPPKINEKFIPKSSAFFGAQNISNNLAKSYKEFCQKSNWDFIDASEVEIDKTDGIHLDVEGNKKLAELIINYLNKVVK